MCVWQHAGHVGIVPNQLAVLKDTIKEDVALQLPGCVAGDELAHAWLGSKDGPTVDEPDLVCGIGGVGQDGARMCCFWECAEDDDVCRSSSSGSDKTGR